MAKMMSLLLGSQSGLPSSNKEKKEKKNDIMPPRMQAPRSKNDKMMLRPFSWVSSNKEEVALYTTREQHFLVLYFPLFLHRTLELLSTQLSLDGKDLDNESQNTSTNSHDASTELHSTTSSSSSLATSASRRSSSRTRRISIGSSNIAVCSQQSTTALLSNSLNGLEIGSRAIRVLKQAGCAGCEESL